MVGDGASDTPWTFAAESTGLAQCRPVTLVDGSTFLVGGASGDLSGRGAEGLFMLDTRVLSLWELRVEGRGIEALSVVADGPFSATYVGRFRTASDPDQPLAVVRRRHLGHGMLDEIEIRNHSAERHRLSVTLGISTDFAGLFDVKADRVGRRESALPHRDGEELELTARDVAPVRATLVRLEPPPLHVAAATASWSIELAPGGRWSLCAEVGARTSTGSRPPAHRCGEPHEHAIPVARLRRWTSSTPDLESDDPALDQAFAQAVEDLGALRIFDPARADRVVVAAGAPWFMTLFGRDSILSAWMALLVDHDLAFGVLGSLADAQGSRVNPRTEEEPGRILHEVRFDPTSELLLGGSNVYYGSIDATPLFVMLANEVLAWTEDRDRLAPLLPAVDRALAWLDEYGDRDEDGFVEYERATPAGLVNQGWKDSWDGIRHADGSVAQAPIALSEVQAYTHAALLAGADLAAAFGDEVASKARRDRAADLRRRFDERFWSEHVGGYAIGLDRDKRPIESRTSNMGHCLWTGIVPAGRAATIARTLGAPDMASGWGLRTLADTNPAYNPLSYHCGSVWPHDTAIAVAGLYRYGHEGVAGSLARALLDASAHSGGRLPELFAGFDRGDIPAPVPYPTSCSPQAWAAASPLLVLRAALGLQPDLARGTIRLRPRDLPGVGRLRLSGVPVGAGRLSVEVVDGEVTDLDVVGIATSVEVVVA